ncbi:maleylpyruvate isomerase N-terminal domain-containing protein [Streptomyces sp. NPDC048518]|uniref:maleylpyruvate isomerase N-terminal domain-containing protein n=1 Tax=Streptomyces sp. NPDC048518 TaxID=3155029 RepID=UPI0033F6EC60
MTDETSPRPHIPAGLDWTRAAPEDEQGPGPWIEIAFGADADGADPDAVYLRETSDPDNVVTTTRKKWDAFVLGVQAGEFDHFVDGGGITAADIGRAVRLALPALRTAATTTHADWNAKAGPLDWNCRQTLAHLADDLYGYAAQLTAQLDPNATPPSHHTPTTDVDALLHAVESGATLLADTVTAAPPTTRAPHGWGASDPDGFAAMAVVEILVHTYDIVTGLGAPDAWTPPADLCARVLTRLFPDAPTDPAPWPTLLWVTGRGELPGHPRRTEWRWYGAPDGER